jgi:subtilisin family serine protease
MFAAPVNDPLYPEQWALEHIGAEAAWERIGSFAGGVVVAVIDTGIRTAHPDLAGHLWTDALGRHGSNVVDGNYNVFDAEGHGTQLAGTIGARSNNAVGIAAAGWPIRLMTVKFLRVDRPPDAFQAAWAIVWAVKQGAQIINAAWGVSVDYLVVRNAIQFAQYWGSGALVVAAAGNDGLDNDQLPTYPASFKGLWNLLSVMACTKDDDRASFSNYGQTTVHLAAPGIRVLTTDTYFGAPRWRSFSGTSAACALVSYAAAVIKTMNPSWPPYFIRRHLMQSATPSRWLKCVAQGRLSLDRAVLGPFTISSPTVGDIWNKNTSEPVTWTYSYDTGVSTTTVTFELSVDGGPYQVIAFPTANDGSTTVHVPDVVTTEARLRIRSRQAPAFFADSAVFTIK